MSTRALAALARGGSNLLMRCRLREWAGADLARPALVFAPHPDDETLGCGGTAVHKRRAGARVGFVFLTDGSRSHSDLMPSEQMRKTRAAEAVAAARVLGVAEGDVTLLGFPDGELERHEAEAAGRVAEILRRERPEEVFVPYHSDGPPDHHAANRVVQAALARAGLNATVCEYPIWFLHFWPWTGAPRWGRELRHAVADGLHCTRALLRDFRHFVRVDDVLDVKRAALAEHRSQVEHLVPDPRWVTLGDIAGGAFLARFFQGREIFYAHPPVKGN
jgi:LmbE family N-acetylglucosaminyl deacetylase